MLSGLSTLTILQGKIDYGRRETFFASEKQQAHR